MYEEGFFHRKTQRAPEVVVRKYNHHMVINTACKEEREETYVFAK